MFLDKSGLIYVQKLSVGFRSGLLAQCTNAMLYLPFYENINFAAGNIVILEEVIVPIT